MWQRFLIVFAFIYLTSCSPMGLLQSKSVQEDLKFLGKFFSAHKTGKILDMTVSCALCGVVVNEVMGFLSENLTNQEMVTLLDQQICEPLGGEAEAVCDILMGAVPIIVDGIATPNSVSTVCVDLSLCTIPFPSGHPDMVPVPEYIIDLDADPKTRWTNICSVPLYQQQTQYMYNTMKNVLPNGGKDLELIGEELNNKYYPADYAQEVIGCAAGLGIPYGWAALFQLGYEVSDACTSIVAQAEDGTIWHARNLDFSIGMAFTEILKELTIVVHFQQGGKTLFTATTYAGYIGVLSGIKPDAFSVTIDTRFYPNGIGQLFYEIIAAIQEKNASLVAFLSRATFETQKDWNGAMASLSNQWLIADVYYIVAGVSAGQGAVISRNRTDAADVWVLNNPSRWFEVETNYDHWNPAPWYDDRRDPANHNMNALGQSNLNMPNLFSILSQKPTLNLQTTYSIVAHPATGAYSCFKRYCQYPCVQ